MPDASLTPGGKDQALLLLCLAHDRFSTNSVYAAPICGWHAPIFLSVNLVVNRTDELRLRVFSRRTPIFSHWLVCNSDLC